MKFLVVNADDFGLSTGVNTGIIRSHQHGIVTSTSLMVDGVAAQEASQLANLSNLSIGLHFQLTDERLIGRIQTYAKLYLDAQTKVEEEFNRQLDKFEKLVGRQPDHLDSHHHIHNHPHIRPLFQNYSRRHGIPVRDLSAPCIRSFFGWGKLWRTQLQRISSDNLRSILTNLSSCPCELMCHPAMVDAELIKRSRYSSERQTELQTLTSEPIKELIKEQGIQLINWRQLNSIDD